MNKIFDIVSIDLIGFILSILASFSALILLLKKLIPVLERKYYKNPTSKTAKIIKLFIIVDDESSNNYKERINKSLKNLKSVSKEVDNIINEVEKLANEKQSAIERLAQKEKELTILIDGLQNNKALELVELVLKKNDKKSAKRDYMLVALSVLITTAISILVTLLLNKSQ